METSDSDIYDICVVLGGNMDYRKIQSDRIEDLWELQLLYKAEIGEDIPKEEEKERLVSAMDGGQILFFGAWDEAELVGCCSVTPGFSTFNFQKSGVFEDFYIRPAYRHRHIARELVQYAYVNSGVCSLTVGCADCDLPMYRALGFAIDLGNLLAFE